MSEFYSLCFELMSNSSMKRHGVIPGDHPILSSSVQWVWQCSLVSDNACNGDVLGISMSPNLMTTPDELLFAFMIPLLPTVLERRIGLEPSLTQRYTSVFLAEGAFVSVVSSPCIGSIADAVSSKKTLLLTLLVLALVSTACLSLTSQRMYILFP